MRRINLAGRLCRRRGVVESQVDGKVVDEKERGGRMGWLLCCPGGQVSKVKVTTRHGHGTGRPTEWLTE